jgi:hypothetical protein
LVDFFIFQRSIFPDMHLQALVSQPGSGPDIATNAAAEED